jgi:iron-sulfur cluster assembly accessory protein
MLRRILLPAGAMLYPPCRRALSSLAPLTADAVIPGRRRQRERPAAIQLTDKAADRLRELLLKKSEAAGIRLGVKRRGCNGYSYTLNYVSERPPKDEEVVKDGVRVFIDPMATFYIAGTIMDWEESELSAEFTFSNPNVAGRLHVSQLS